MNRKFIALIFFTIISLVLFSSCKNSIEHNPKEKLVQVSGFVSTNGILEDSDVESDISRTALPDVSELVAGNQFYYKIIAEQEGSDTKTAYSLYPTYTIGLPLGTWKLSAYIYKGSSKDACVEANLLFEPDKTVEVTLEESDIYKPKTGNGLSTKIAQGSGSGTVNLKVAVESIYVADAVTATMDGKTQSKLFSGSILEQNIDFDGYEFASGSYLLNLTFFKDSQVVFVCSQWVNIINSLQTTKWVIDNNTPYFDGTGFSLTSTCIVYQNMTDFYVDPTADSSNDLGTPYNPFKTIDKAIAKCINPELDYTIKLCGDITGNGTNVPISIAASVKGKSIKICSSDSSVKRIVKAGPQEFVSQYCVSITDCTIPITFSGFQFMGSKANYVIHTQKSDSITGMSHVILENCIIGSLDEISDFASFDSKCANKASGVYCKNVKLTLDGCVIKNNNGSGVYMAGYKQPELEIKNTTITNNLSADGAVRFNSMILELVLLTGRVQIFNNYTDTDASQQKNLFIEYNTNGSFTIDGALDSNTKIGVSCSDTVTLPFVFTSGFFTNNSNSPDRFFFSDDPSKEIVWNAENTEAVIRNKIVSANAYYVAGSDAKVLSAPAEGVTPDGSLTAPFTSVQAAVEAISVTESKTGVIYIDGTVEDTPQESGSESKCTVQITNGANITILGYTEGSATGGVIKTSNPDTRVIAIWDFDKGTTVTLGANLTITGGNVTTSNCGGGIVNGAILILDGCTITGNKVNGDTAMGGGVYCNQESVTTIKNGTVISNNTSGKFGGGLTVCGGILSIEGGTFSGNIVEAADGAGSDIQLKVYEDWTGGSDTGIRQDSEVVIKNDFVRDGTILIGYNNKTNIPQTLTFAKEISNDYVFDLDSNIVVGDKFADLDTGIFNSVYNHLKISSGDLYVDSEGIICEKTTPGSIAVENVNKTSVDIGEIDRVFFSKNDTANNVIILTLSNKAKAALGVSAYVTFQLYSVYGGNDALISSKNIYITEGTARYQLENFQNIEVGTYKLHVSAVSNIDNYVIESKIFTITVGY